MNAALGKVFISHASSDKPRVEKLIEDLVQHGVSIWYDKLDLPLGAMRREQELRSPIAARGPLTPQRLKELVDTCFAHM